MTKNDKTYTTQLNVVLDPRDKFTVEDRTAQFNLMMRIGRMLNHMSWAVDSIIGVRDDANARAAKLGANDPLRKSLTSLADDADAIRKKIVATKEGGAITGEERLREFVGGLYGDVSGYEGRPTNEQSARADALDHELADVIKEFTSMTDSRLPALNRQLAAKKLEGIKAISEADWEKMHASELGGYGTGASSMRYLTGN